MAGADIDEVEVTLPGESTATRVGMRHENRSVHLCLLGDGSAPDDISAAAVTTPASLLALLREIRKRYFVDVGLNELDWRVRAGNTASAVTLSEAGPLSCRMTLSNELVLAAHRPPIAAYRADALDECHPRSRGRSPPRHEQTYYTQYTPDGNTYMFHAPDDATVAEVVHIDVRRLEEVLQQHAPEQLTSPEHRLYKRQRALTGNWSEHPQELLRISCFRTSERLVFSLSGTGCVDFLAALQDSGAVSIPVAVAPDQAPLLRALCGAATPPPSRPAPHKPPSR
jgi:hypothetical protein